MKSTGLKRRTIRRKPGQPKPECLAPKKKVRGGPYSQTKDYKYFHGHIIPEVAKNLPDKAVVCWKNGHSLSLPICAIKKFWKETSYCKRCPLFQKDEHAKQLRSIIEQWETDDLMEE